MYDHLNWKEFTGSVNPVNDNALILYRTVIEESDGWSKISHIHMPAKAGDINWNNKNGIGRIHKYAVLGIAKSNR